MTRWRIISYYLILCLLSEWIHAYDGCINGTTRALHCPNQTFTRSMNVYLQQCMDDNWIPVCIEHIPISDVQNMCKKAMRLGSRINMDPERRRHRPGFECQLQELNITNVTSNLSESAFISTHCDEESFIFCNSGPGFGNTGDKYSSLLTVSWNESRIKWKTDHWVDECDKNLCKSYHSPVSYHWARRNMSSLPNTTVWTTSAFVYEGYGNPPGDPDFNQTLDLEQCAMSCLEKTDPESEIRALTYLRPNCYCSRDKSKVETMNQTTGSTNGLHKVYLVVDETQVPGSYHPFDNKPELCITWTNKRQFAVQNCADYLPVLCIYDICAQTNRCSGKETCRTNMKNTSMCICDCKQRCLTRDQVNILSNKFASLYSCFCQTSKGNFSKFEICQEDYTSRTFTITEGTTTRTKIQPATQQTVLITSLSLTISITLAVVFIICCICYVTRKRIRRQNGEIQNATANRLYGEHNMLLNDQETYTSVIEVDQEVTKVITPDAPMLPPRRRISTLDEYSCPTDVLQCRLSDTTPYSMPYDDTRRKRTKSDGDLNFPNPDFSEEGSTEHLFTKGSRKPFSSEKDKSKYNADEICGSLQLLERNLVHFDNKAVVFNNIQKAHPDDLTKTMDGQNQNKDKRPTSVTCTGNCIRMSNGTKVVERRCSKASSYEDTSIVHSDTKRISGSSVDSYEDTTMTTPFKFSCQATSELFPEHVCLECIPQEVLTKLGIRIVKETDVYDTNYNFRRSLDRLYEDNVYQMHQHSKESPDYFVLTKQNGPRREITRTQNGAKCLMDMVYDAIGANIRRQDDSTNVYDHISHIERPVERVPPSIVRRFSL